MQHKTQRPVQFEIAPATRDAVQKWIKLAALKSDEFVFWRLMSASWRSGVLTLPAITCRS